MPIICVGRAELFVVTPWEIPRLTTSGVQYGSFPVDVCTMYVQQFQGLLSLSHTTITRHCWRGGGLCVDTI